MRIAVITPYYKEDEAMLLRCISSVKAQTHSPVTHILVADGHPHPNHGAWGVEHMIIPNCGDYGDTPRAVGAAVASCQGYDAVAFLDADNWYEPDHLALAASRVTPQTPIVTTGRMLRDLEGNVIAHDLESDGVNFCDTNCYLIARPAFRVIGLWTFKERKLGIIGDRIFWANLPKEHVARSEKPTLNYTTKFAVHYLGYGKTPPLDAIRFVNGPDGLPVAQRYYN